MDNTTAIVTITPKAQEHIIDQILVQSGGVGLGVVLTLVGAVAIAHWLGLKPAIAGWIERQKAQTEAMETFSTAFRKFVDDYHESTREIKDSLSDIKDGIKDALTPKRR